MSSQCAGPFASVAMSDRNDSSQLELEHASAQESLLQLVALAGGAT